MYKMTRLNIDGVTNENVCPQYFYAQLWLWAQG